MSAWIWNYFTIESIYNVKCRLCDNCVRPTITTAALLFNHITHNATDHETAVNKLKEYKFLKNIPWDEYYETLHSLDNYFNPIAKCNHCGHEISNADSSAEIRKKPFLHVSTEMKSHLKKEHEVDESNWIVLNNLIRDSEAYYMTKFGMIQLYTCKKCINNDNESQNKNAVMFAKHMIDKHFEEFKEKFSRDKVPKELLPLYDSTVGKATTLSSGIADRPGPSRLDDSSSRSEEPPSKRKQSNVKLTVREDTTLSSDIARPGPSHQGSSGVFSESTQISRKRKEKVLKKMSEPEVSTQIEEPLYKRRKSSSTDDSD